MTPEPYTVRELFWMARGAWDRTARLCCVFANANRSSSSSAIDESEFHPYRKRELPVDPDAIVALAE